MLILFIIFFPLVGGLVLLLARHTNPRWLATTVTAVEWLASLVLLSGFNRDASVQFTVDVPWVTSLGMRFSVGVDGISLLLVLLTTTLVPLIVMSSFNVEHHPKKNYYGLILVMPSSLVGVF